MLVSSRGRYALRILTELASRDKDSYVPMKELSTRQGISLKYMETIMPLLVKGGLVEGLSGKKGGYRLTREPDRITAMDVFSLTEGDLSPVSCLSKNADPCAHAAVCPTAKM